MLKHANNTSHQYSAVMLEFAGPTAERIKKLAARITDGDLDPTEGREAKPHVTVLYGLHTDEPDKVVKALQSEGSVGLKFGGITLFDAKTTGQPYDVVKIDIDSPDLRKLNQKLRDELPYTSKHPEYKPHATLAYVKASKGQAYVGKSGLEGQQVTSDQLVFQTPAKARTVITLKQSKAASDLSRLKGIKADSDRGDYDSKVAKLMKMMTSRPQDWRVDDRSGPNWGVTHVPTGFRLHMPAMAVPGQVKRSDNLLYRIGPAWRVATMRQLGPLPAAAAKTAIGYGGGQLLARLLFKNPRTRKAMGHTMGLTGAVGVNALTPLDIASQISLANRGEIKGIDPAQGGAWWKSLFSSYPYRPLFGKASSFFSVGELVDLQPGDMGPSASPHMVGGFSPYTSNHHTSVAAAANSVMADVTLNPMEKARALYAIDLADSGNDFRGLVTTPDLIRGAIGAGMGAMAGRVLGALGGLPSATQSRMARVGAVGGLLRATGLWRN
jgi:2'-5' RNA ligase